MVGVERQCSNFLKCIKNLLDYLKESEVQQIIEKLNIIKEEYIC